MKKLLFISSTMLFTYSAFKAQNCAELFISKYASLGSNNKCVEIYNPTNAPIVLNGKYYIARYKTPTASGNTSGPVPNTYAPSTNGDTVWLKGTIASYSTWVVCNPEVTPNPGNFNSVCNPTLAAKANQKGNFYATYGANVGDPTYFKGCDAITLEKKVLNTYSIIDMIGRQGDTWPRACVGEGRTPGTSHGWTSWILPQNDVISTTRSLITGKLRSGATSICPCRSSSLRREVRQANFSLPLIVIAQEPQIAERQE